MRWIKFEKSNRLLATLCTSILLLVFTSLFSPVRSNLKEAPPSAVFEEAWQTVNNNFYDPKFNGVDWKAMQQKYEPLAKQAKSVDEVSTVVNRMLSQLNSSHTHFYTKSEPAYYQLLGIFKDGFLKEIKKFFPGGNIDYTGIGVFSKEISGKTFINAVLDGSPAAQAGLKVGDQILAVDGNKYQPIQSFINKANKPVSLSVQRTPEPNSVNSITVTPKQLNPSTMFLDAMRASVKVTERDRKKIGYIHIWSYASDQYQDLLEEEVTFGKLKDADSLILDLRDGWGGATPNYLSIFSNKVPILTEVPRSGKKTTLDYQWRKPVVMVINNGTRSGKEILAYGFKQYGIGPLLGTKTAGAVLGARPFLLQDGSLLYLPVVDVFVNSERLEGKGVVPDIEVLFQLEYAQGSDPQQEKAVEFLAAASKK